MYVHVPAMRGKLGSRTYYSCLMPMSAIPNMFKFTNWINGRKTAESSVSSTSAGFRKSRITSLKTRRTTSSRRSPRHTSRRRYSSPYPMAPARVTSNPQAEARR